MGEFLVERFVSRANAEGVAADTRRARLAAEQMTQEGTSVRHLRSIFIPEDETCLELYRAPSEDAVRQAASRAGIVFDRVSEVGESNRRRGS